VLAPAVSFSQVALAVHIAAVLVAFGVTFAHPLMVILSERIDRRAIPWAHRLEQALGRWLVNPGLTLVLIAGIVLASDEHKWHSFFVQWGLGVTIVLGGLEGSFMIPQSGKLAQLAERDLATGEAAWSDEYRQRRQRVTAVGALMSGLVLITVYLMTVHA
jgi:hypothetical protein